ncbi:hypothetical protein AB0M46_46565, partial [Dactylosporangium sp. NPDC051485]
MQGEGAGRVRRFAGRLMALPELPAVAAALLGLAALVETVRRGLIAEPLLPAALLLDVCAAAPVALLRSRPMWAAAATTATTSVTLAMFRWPPIAVLAAALVALYTVGRHHRATVSGWFVAPFVAYAILGPPGGGQDGRTFALAVAAAAVAACGA